MLLMQETVVRRTRPNLPTTSFAQRTLSAIGSTTNSTVRRRVSSFRDGEQDEIVDSSAPAASGALQDDSERWDLGRSLEAEAMLAGSQAETDDLQQISDELLAMRQQVPPRRTASMVQVRGNTASERLANASARVESEAEATLSRLPRLDALDRVRRRHLLGEASAPSQSSRSSAPVLRERTPPARRVSPDPGQSEFANTLRAIRRAYTVAAAPPPPIPTASDRALATAATSAPSVGATRSHAFASFSRERRQGSRPTEAYRPGRVIRGEAGRTVVPDPEHGLGVDYEELLGSSSSAAALAPPSATLPAATSHDEARPGEHERRRPIRTIIRPPMWTLVNPTVNESERGEAVQREEDGSGAVETEPETGARRMTAAEFLRDE
jgi:hypothetical protein